MDNLSHALGKRFLKSYDKFQHESFCMAPFNQIYIGRDGDVRTCCFTRNNIGNLYNQKLDKIINDKEAVEIRNSILNKKDHYNCDSCVKYRQKTGLQNNVQTFSNDWVNFSNMVTNLHKLDDTAKDIDNLLLNCKDGRLREQHPIFLDILVSNKCNFACIGCNGELSSTIRDNYNTIANLVNEHKSYGPNWEGDIDPIIEYILEHKDSIKVLHLNGGEPFMQHQFHKLLQALIDEKLCDKITIWSHTNGHITSYKGVDIVEKYLSHWQNNLLIVMSHDHFGKRGNYVRFPYQDKKWLHNYNRLKEIGQVDIQSGYNIFNALTIDKQNEWYKQNNIDTIVHYNPWHSPFCYTAFMLQKFPNLYAKAIEKLEQIQDNNLLQNINADTSKHNLNELHDKFVKSISMWDKKRNTNFVETFPELEEIYSN